VSNAVKPIELPEDLQAFAEERVRVGEYASVADVVRDALEQKQLAVLREALDVGLAQVEAGQSWNRSARAAEGIVAPSRWRRSPSLSRLPQIMMTSWNARSNDRENESTGSTRTSSNKPSLSSRKTRRAVARLLPRLNPGSSDTTSSNRGVTRDTSCSTHTTRRTIA